MSKDEINTPQFHKKTTKKAHKGGSGAQDVSPALTFSWDKSKKNVQGKAFNRKRAVPAAPSNAEQFSAPSNSESTEVSENKFIKRKKRKDKLLNKQLLEESEPGGLKKPQSNQRGHSLFSERHKDVHVDAHGGKSVSEDVFAISGNSFRDLDIHKYLVSNLEKINFIALTNVQEKAIPVILTGKDTLIRSQTGSGKTLAYAVPVINALQSIVPKLTRKDGVQAVIVVPTRELALQTHELFGKINTFQWIVVGYLCGGENRKSEKDRLRKGVNVLIGTPGRLLDHVLHTSALKLDKVRCLVLDEADRLLDMGFRKDIISLVQELDKARTNSDYDPMSLLKKSNNSESDGEQQAEPDSTIPPLRDVHSTGRQTILLSATLSKGVSELADFAMKDHTYIDALDDKDTDHTETDSFVIPSTVRQKFMITYVKHRLFTLAALIIGKCKQNSKLFVFMASAQMVEFHYELFSRHLARMPKNRGKLKTSLNAHGEKVVVFDDELEESDEEEEVVLDTNFFKLHGSMDQKERKEVFSAFRNAKKGVLLCTDVAARGLDVPEADCIVQYTTPQTDKDYLHRVGRTARAGKSGSAIIFLTHEEQEYVAHLKEHKVFLKKEDSQEYLNELCDLMDESDLEQAATALQRHFEAAVAKDKVLQKSACFAYSTWSRYYNSYPTKLRTIFDFKKINLGHYVTSFALRITPTEVSGIVRGQVANMERPKLNKKLQNHREGVEGEREASKQHVKGKKQKSWNLVTSEFESGLEPMKKKMKKNK